MNWKLLPLFIIFLLISCTKDDSGLTNPEKVILKPYMTNLVPLDTLNPYKGDYYIHVTFKNTNSSDSHDLFFTYGNQTGGSTSIQTPDTAFRGVGWSLTDTTSGEELEIAFHYNVSSDTIFNIWYANYRFANSWNFISGANIYYFKPVEYQSNTFFMYLGTNSADSFFKIHYFGNDRINGSFRTIWEECCGEKTTYSASGDFSIPALPKLKYLSIHAL